MDWREANSHDFKLLPRSECCIIAFGWFPGVWILYADVSEHSACSICIVRVEKTTYEYGTDRAFRNVGI
jgi:hypothetical protein